MSSEPSRALGDEAPRPPETSRDDADAADAPAATTTAIDDARAPSTEQQQPLATQCPDAVRFDDFRCPICLDLLYKPCAPAAEHCSHAFCFWCLHAAMSPFADSRCPLDRGRFSHQPAVAVVLHRALARLFPAEYRRRARETREEEEASNTRSQAVDDDEEVEREEEEREEEQEEEGGQKGAAPLPPLPPKPPLSPADFACSKPGCGRLLLDPVVLNCGHAVCGGGGGSGSGSGSGSGDGGGLSTSSSCVPGGRACEACGGAGRVGGAAPRTCALLAGLIEALFPEEVAARRREARGGAGGEEQGNEAPPPPPPAPEAAAAAAAPEAAPAPRPSARDTHFGIGCDACGAYPLRGRRFRCLDCAEAVRVGFDLCEDCYADHNRRQEEEQERGEGEEAATAGAATPRGGGAMDGRFAQGHLPSHRFEEVPLRRGILHRVAEAHPELSMEQVLRLMQLAVGRERGENGGGGRGGGGRGGGVNDDEEEDDDEADDDDEDDDEFFDESDNERELEAIGRAVERSDAMLRERARMGLGPRPFSTRTTTSFSASGPVATMHIELDPSRLPEGFPFATVLELEEFFNVVESAGGPGGELPAETRMTLERWFPDLARFLETHTGGGGEGGGGEEEAEEEDEVERTTAVEDDVEACVATAAEKQPEEQERIQRQQSPRSSTADDEACRRRLRLRRRLRPLRRGDLPAVRAAHAELFPIDYEEAFYEAVAEGTGGVFSLGLFDDDEEGEDGKSRGPAAPSSLPSLLSPAPAPTSCSTLVAFVTARLQNASHVDRTDAAYLGLLEEAEREARDEAEAAAAAGTVTATATTSETTTTAATPPPPQQPLGPGVDLLGPAPSRPAAAYILTLGVSKKRRGEGIGKMLVAAVAERAAASICCCPVPSSSPPPAPPQPLLPAAAALVYLHVAAFNPPAVSLYRSCGFSRLATLPDFYSISTERRPDPARTRYAAHLFAMRIEAASSSSASSSAPGAGGGEEALWPWPLPPPPPLPPPLLAPAAPSASSPSPSPPLAFPPAVAALAGALSWLSSLASSLLARVTFGPAKKGEEGEKEGETLPRTVPTTTEEAARAPPPAPWLSRLFRRTG